jgi:hypothetical protein
MVIRSGLYVGRETGEQETQRRHAMLRSYVMDQPEVTQACHHLVCHLLMEFIVELAFC